MRGIIKIIDCFGGVKYIIYTPPKNHCARGILITKAELVAKVAAQINLTRKQTEIVVNGVFQSITDSLSAGKKVELRGFGSFRIRERNPRVGRNPKSGDKLSIPAKKVPFFKTGKELRALVDK